MDPSSLIARIGGIQADQGLAHSMSNEVSDLLSRDGHRVPRAFPGAQPVSFSRRHLNELAMQDYYVCEKTDGTRYLLYLTQGDHNDAAAYFIDRKNDYYYVPQLHFPMPDDPTFTKFHLDTILDGELVCDTYSPGHSEIKFLIFDCLIVDGRSLLNRPLDKRLGYFKDFILKPYKTFYQKFPNETHSRRLLMEDKNTELSYGVEKMFREVIPKVKRVHGNDGLIFTCRGTGYRMGTDEHILKWKPPEENTIDFLLRIVWREYPPDHDDPDQSPVVDYQALPARFELWVFAGGREEEYKFYDEMHVTEQEWEALKATNRPLQEAIVECYMEHSSNPHPQNGTTVGGGGVRWRFHRLRDDKLNGNHVSVVDKVMESIKDAIGEEDLIRESPRWRETWKRRQAEEDAARRRGHGSQQPPGQYPGGGVERRMSEMHVIPGPGGGEDGVMR